MKQLRSFWKSRYGSHVTLLAVVLILGLAGTIALLRSHAATPFIAVEPENGIVTSPATSLGDSSASGGTAIKFTSPVTPGGFVHPGILVDKAQLDFVKAKVAGGAEPWTTAFNNAKTVGYYSLRAPHLTNLDQKDATSTKCNAASPGTGCVVACGNASVPDDGCTDEENDASGAYNEALMWYYTGQESYAQSAVTMLNSWSAVLKNHTNTNAALQASWAGEVFTRAAEIMRYTYTPSAGKAAFNVPQFTSMLDTAFLPVIQAYNYSGTNGNWELSAIDAQMNIAIFKDDHTLYNQMLAKWRARVPAYVYLTSDGSLPVVPPGNSNNTKSYLTCFWLNSSAGCGTANTTFQNGQIQETCRDFTHVGLGLAAMFDTAETANIQGTDLYSEQKGRLTAGLEYNTNILNTTSVVADYPSNFCIAGDRSNMKNPVTAPTYQIAYNAYANRLGVSLPATLKTVQRQNAAGGSARDHMMDWETLTHYGNTAK